MRRYLLYAERHSEFPDTIIVSYPFRWGGQLSDRWMWMAELNGEIWDWGSREALVTDALAHDYHVVVLRVHRNGSASVVIHYEAGHGATPARTAIKEQSHGC